MGLLAPNCLIKSTHLVIKSLTHGCTVVCCLLPYVHKFSGDVIFAVFVGNLSSTIIKAYGALSMILENKTARFQSSAKFMSIENLYVYDTYNVVQQTLYTSYVHSNKHYKQNFNDTVQ